jgi:hypothetical protein
VNYFNRALEWLRITRTPELPELIRDILCGGTHFLSGVNGASSSLDGFLKTVSVWGRKFNHRASDVQAVIEPCFRQNILMSLLPAKAFDPLYTGTLDAAIDEHLAQLSLPLGPREKRTILNVCINVRSLRGLNSRATRAGAMTVAGLRGMPGTYAQILARQNDRCIWCGVDLHSTDVQQTLEHVAPYYLGDDMPDSSNWALSCRSCNEGKGDALAWAAQREAHGFIPRVDLSGANQIALQHRWIVLMRSKRCKSCNHGTRESELWVFRVISTGLPIPANCGVACGPCAIARNWEILLPKWAATETSRVRPI